MAHPIVSLTVARGPFEGQEYIFHSPVACVVGRADNCCPRIPAMEISRRHCVFKIKPPSAWVQDLESTNGTFLNRLRLASEKAIALADGDEIALANQTIFQVRLASEEDESNAHGGPSEHDSKSFVMIPNVTPACFEVIRTTDELLIRFFGCNVQLGTADLRVVQNHIEDVVGPLSETKVALDFRNVESVDTEALAILVRLHKRLSALHGGLRAIHMSPYICEICAAARLFDSFEISRAKGELVGSS